MIIETDRAELVQKREKIHNDFFNNVIPERMPINMTIMSQIVAEAFGANSIDYQYDISKISNCFDNMSEKIYTDSFPYMPPILVSRSAAPYQLMNAQSFIMGKTGMVQHPEVVGMENTEYDALINRGVDFLVDTVIPRQHKNLDPKDPIKMAYAMKMVDGLLDSEMMIFLPIMMNLINKHGYHSGAPMGSFGISEAPFDFLADQLRSFSGISGDVRRHASKIKDACEVLMPMMFQWGLPDFTHPEGGVTFYLHMPTFMREKDFLELFLPTFKTILEQYAARGVRSTVYLEDDWTRYIDIVLSEFPAGTILDIEKGDPKLFKEKLGKKFILRGMFLIEHVRMLPKDKMLDKAKEFLDIMLPECGYLFSFDKMPLMLCDVNLDNLQSLMEFVRDYSYYERAGESFGLQLNSENFKIDPTLNTPIQSQYTFNWEKFTDSYPLAPDFAKTKFENLNQNIIKWYLGLLV